MCTSEVSVTSSFPFSMVQPYAVKTQKNIADENVTDYIFLSRYHYNLIKELFKRNILEIVTDFPLSIGTPCVTTWALYI